MARPTQSLAARARGALRGALAGERAADGDGNRRGETALRRILAEELAAGRTDLRLLAEHWVEHHQATPGSVGRETAAALDYLAKHHAPAEQAAGDGPEVLARVVPVGLVACGSPRNLVSATFHIASLTHPGPRAAWAAVAVNVALARFVLGKRDFVADVIEALRGNAAPDELINAVRRVPVARREGLPPLASAGRDAVSAVEIVLWLGYHEALLGRGLDWLTTGGTETAALTGAAAALLGARDGADAVPLERLPRLSDLAEWDRLADQLVRVGSPV